MYPEGQTLSLHDARPISGSRSPISSRVESADRWKPSRDWRARCASIWKIWCKREFRRSSFASPDPKKPALRFFTRRTIVGALENAPVPLPSAGKLWLVGAGPGDPELLTLRAARRLTSADLIVHDGLVGDDVLALIPPHVTRISVAKQRSRHTMRQEAINALDRKSTRLNSSH